MRFLTSLALCCSVATSAPAQDSIVTQLQAGKFACQTIDQMWTLLGTRTPAGIQRITKGCWMVGGNEILSGFPPRYAVNENGTEVITYQQVQSTRSRRPVILFLWVELVDVAS